MSDAVVDVEAVLAGLKDFQRRTAEWVVERMFDETDPAHRFLVADEVGLGKTHVAKGVLAQVIDHLGSIGDERHDIVYVCSNAAIAAQNLRKLSPRGIAARDRVERLTLLPLSDLDARDDDGDGPPVNLLAITPGTSLAFGRSTGAFKERVLAYAFLRELWGASAFPARGRWVFWEGVNAESGDDRLRERARSFAKRIRRHVPAFEEELDRIDRQRQKDGAGTLWEDYEALTEGLAWKRSFPDELKPMRRAFIGDIRRAMATVGISQLDPDLVILDEFQRFKDLLDPDGDTWAAQLAHRLFTHRDLATGRPTRTLLLSATPYRMYTLDEEEGEDHYEDFLRTCAFLMDDPERVGALEGRFRALRAALTDPHSIGRAGDLCAGIEAELRSVMARTERLAATPDRGGMLHEPPAPVTIEATDLAAYVRLGDLAEQVAGHDPAEYWKSSPYLFNFMESYHLKRSLEEAVAAGALPEGEHLAPGPGMLDWEAVDAYQRIDPQNGRLRWLVDGLEAQGAFDLLWIPPSLPYYSAGGRYEAAAAAGLTKRLVFSGWTVVPKVLASLLSHEAERRAFSGQGTTYTTDYSARGGRRLDFRLEGGRPAAMTAFLFVWPSPSLAVLGDPRGEGPGAASGGSERPFGGRSLRDVLAEVRGGLDQALRPLVAGASREGPVDQRWYWAAPLLLDKRRYPEVVDRWFPASARGGTAWSGGDEGAADAGRGFARHAQAALEVLDGTAERLGRVPDDLVDVLAEVAVAGPAVCALRAVHAVSGLALVDEAVLDAAARIAWGARALFNSPEVTALVEAQEPEDLPYWRAAVGHAAVGNLQAVLDEHLHVLRDWLGFLELAVDDVRRSAAKEMASKVAEALGVRTASLRVDVPEVNGDGLVLDERRMRARFAVPFGSQRSEDGGEARIEALSAAFNSPFWPFVLASTSVGQEGLDFHLWCHGVVHWNLPTNPVDLEQREGRVHRFKNHAVRRNLASSLGAEVLDGGCGDGSDPWEGLFELAASRRADDESEMVPYWIYSDGPARIQRWAPVPPFSRDAALLPRLRRSLAVYRLAMGQPRQQELLEYLGRTLTEAELASLADDLRIDLTPRVAVVG